jgi:hypothetical protein
MVSNNDGRHGDQDRCRRLRGRRVDRRASIRKIAEIDTDLQPPHPDRPPLPFAGNAKLTQEHLGSSVLDHLEEECTRLNLYVVFWERQEGFDCMCGNCIEMSIFVSSKLPDPPVREPIRANGLARGK